jgi:DNA polymerase III subunit delta
MIIKEQDLDQYIKQLNFKLYLFHGTDQYLLNQAAIKVKQAYTSLAETDVQVLHLNTATTWHEVIQHANSYSLLSDQVLIDVRCTQKSFDAAAKKLILKYLDKPNPNSLIIIRAPEIPSKSLTWLSNNQQALLINATALSSKLLQNWITQQLKQQKLNFAAQVPLFIQQYTQNNMYACAQIIEKLSLICDTKDQITIEFVAKYLDDQSELPLYELTAACLAADSLKAIQLLRKAQNHHPEPTLVLWYLTQEIRQLLTLQHKIKQDFSINQACQELNIWSSRIAIYTQCVRRLSYEKLLNLLQTAQIIDQKLKTYQTNNIWLEIENLALMLCCK